MFNDALRAQGILSCGKHFPGYSAATIDAHHDLPTIMRTRVQLDEEELAVFRGFMSPASSESTRIIGATPPDTVDSMMICHGWYPCFNQQKTPASLSKEIVSDLLRKELGFQGLIMTDDLDMGAILNEYGLEETIRLAIAAGNDWVMICHRVASIDQVHRTLGQLPPSQVSRALEMSR